MILDFMGETEAMDMYFEDGIFYLDDMEYTREYVEQMDLDDVWEDFS